MKRIVVFLSIAVLMTASFSASAQGKYGRDSAECVKYLGFYKQYMKQGNLKEAAPQWRNAISVCPPTASQNMILDGLKILRFEIGNNKKNPVRVNELVDTLKILHQMRIDNYPKYKAQAYSALSLDMINFMGDSNPEEVYGTLETAIELAKGNIQPVVPVKYMELASKLYQDGKIDATKVMDCYEKVSENLKEVLAAAKDDKEKDEAKSAQATVDNLFSASGVASCENLVKIYSPKYDASPDDKGLLATMVSALSSQNCVEEELFRKAVESLHKQEATYNSAYFLFKLYSGAGDTEKARAFIQEAIDYVESDAATDAMYYFELSQYMFKNGKNGDAFKAAKSSAALAEQASNQELLGKVYLLMAQMWGSIKCGGNEVEARAPYWVAVDYLIKAKAANSELTEEANKLIGSYSSYFPAQSDAFMYDVIDGNPYTVDCNGMRETTRVRTQK